MHVIGPCTNLFESLLTNYLLNLTELNSFVNVRVLFLKMVF